jgi:hypothetical protein
VKTEEPKEFNWSDYLESLNTKDGVLEVFEENKDFIEKACGITLTNIELVGLRVITEKTLKEFYLQEKEKVSKPNKEESLSDIDYKKEILARFFLEFYGLSPADLDRLDGENSEEIFKEYFRRKQESLHLP